MQLHQLEYFVAVAETGGFTRGAERVHVVQSAVSAAVGHLESELGGALFERSHHAVALTAQGLALLPHARAVLAEVSAARDAVASAHGDVVGTVTLGTMAHLGDFDLATLLGGFHGRYPGIAVRLRQTAAGSRTSLDAVRTGALDLALVSPVAGRAPGVVLDPILTEDLAFVCWPGHPLAGRQRVAVADAASEVFVDFPSGWGIRTVADRLFESSGLARTVTTEVTDFALALALVHRRLGVTIIPSSSAPDDGSVVKLPLVGAPSWTVFLARPSGRGLSASALRLADSILAARPSSR